MTVYYYSSFERRYKTEQMTYHMSKLLEGYLLFNSPPLFSNLFLISFNDVINVGIMYMKGNCS